MVISSGSWSSIQTGIHYLRRGLDFYRFYEAVDKNEPKAVTLFRAGMLCIQVAKFTTAQEHINRLNLLSMGYSFFACFKLDQLSEIGFGALNFLKGLAQLNANEQESYLAMTAQQQAQLRIPVYVRDDDRYKVAGYKQFDPVRSSKDLEDAKFLATLCDFIMIASSVTSIYQKIKGNVQRIVPPGNVMLDPASRQPPAPEEEPFDLICRKTIPKFLEEHPPFHYYICPITKCPIRIAVTDPTTMQAFERWAFLNWVFRNGTSPLSRLPVSLHEVQPNLEVQQKIDAALVEISRKLQASIQNALVISDDGKSNS